MWVLLAIILMVASFIACNELLLIAAALFVIAGMIDWLRDDIREIAEGKKTE